MLQGLASWHGSHEQRMRLLRRNIQNVVGDIRRDLPLREVRHVIAPGGDVRFAAAQILEEEVPWGGFLSVPRGGFLAFCDQIVSEDVEQLMEHRHLAQADAETLVPALLAYRELLMETASDQVLVPRASLRAGLLLDLTHRHEAVGIDVFRKQVLASATAFGEKYRCDTNHAGRVAFLAGRLFDELRREHGLGDHERLLLEVAAHLHDVGLYINQRAHHKHSHYILTVSDIFGLSRDELAIVANVARYHRRAMPQKAHASYMSLDSQARVVVNKLAAILRVANALDADHLQKVSDLKLLTDEDPWVLEVEAAGDLTMERLATRARADLMTEVFGRKLTVREAVPEQ
jgi:exopolyphosphatase/guanosine-5'-triphosphate,3'-diphosphate pyrophosphatase